MKLTPMLYRKLMLNKHLFNIHQNIQLYSQNLNVHIYKYKITKYAILAFNKDYNSMIELGWILK